MLPAIFQQLTPHLALFSRGIVKNLFLIAQALLTSRSSNLNTVKDRLGALLGQANRQPASHYKRLIRFFNTSQPHQLTKAILRCTVTLLSGRVRYLILDATTWRLGQKNVHLLVLSLLYQGVAIPILWRDLDKKGHSNARERQSFMEEATQLYNLKGKILLADREYTGQLWFTFLHQQGIDFVIRLQRECYKHDTLKSYRSLEKKALRRKRAVWTWLNWPDCRLKLVMCRNEDPRPPKDPRKRVEPVFYWLTSLDNAQAAPAHYRKRWRIEQCFKALKTNGFDLESMKRSGVPVQTIGQY